MDLVMSSHAADRGQERGIRQDAIHLLLRFGTYQPNGRGGAMVVSMTAAGRAKASRDLGREYGRLCETARHRGDRGGRRDGNCLPPLPPAETPRPEPSVTWWLQGRYHRMRARSDDVSWGDARSRRSAKSCRRNWRR